MDKHRSASASISQPTKSSTPQNVTPFHSIFLSLTRPIPIPAPNSTTQTYIPYLVLFQHNRHLFQRLKAAEPENNNDNTTKQQKQIYKNAGLTYKTPQQTSRKDARGDLFVKEAWSECVERCDGRVILVSCCDLIPLLDTGTTSCTSTTRSTRTRTDEHTNNHRGRRSGHKNLDLDREERLMQSFRDNGAIVDLHSDPLGWDSDGDSDSDEEQKHNEKDLATSTSTFKGQVTKLQSILSAIHRAAQHIRIQTRDSKCTETGVQMQMQIQPIPIIFDSATPILLHHGVNKLILLLTYLKQQSQHPKTKTKMGMDMDDNTMNGNTPAPASILSPIFLPTLAELLPPSSMRVLEDTSDAVMTLQGGELAIYKRSGRAGGMISSGLSGGLRLIKDVQLFDIEDDGSDEQGGGSGSGSGSVHITSATTNGAGAGAGGGGAVTLGVPTGRLVLRTKKGTTIGGGSSGSGNVKKMNMKNSNDGEVEDVSIATQNMTLNSSAVPGASASASGAEGFASSSGKGGKERLVLMHENENTNAKSNSNANEIDAGRSGGATTEYESAKRPTPRIYLEEDDPEFDDLDEEDPDDDLDI